MEATIFSEILADCMELTCKQDPLFARHMARVCKSWEKRYQKYTKPLMGLVFDGYFIENNIAHTIREYGVPSYNNRWDLAYNYHMTVGMCNIITNQQLFDIVFMALNEDPDWPRRNITCIQLMNAKYYLRLMDLQCKMCEYGICLDRTIEYLYKLSK